MRAKQGIDFFYGEYVESYVLRKEKFNFEFSKCSAGEDECFSFPEYYDKNVVRPRNMGMKLTDNS